MIKRAYLHQFDQLGEQTYEQIANTLHQGGIQELAFKTHQETTWLGNARNGDSSPLAVRGPDDVDRIFTEFARFGIRAIPWCVPMGTSIPAELTMAKIVGSICGSLIELDIEPYKDFWEGPRNLLEPYTNGLEEAGISYEINFDPRAGGWHPFTSAQFSRVCRDAALVSTQSYWGTVGFDDMDETLSMTDQTLDALEVPPNKRNVIFPWQYPSQYLSAYRILDGQGVKRCSFWKMGEAGLSVYLAMRQIPSDTPDNITAALDGIWHQTERLAKIEHEDIAVEIQTKVVDLKRELGR